MNNLEGHIRGLLEEMLAQVDGYLVELKVKPNKVEVFADRDPHITIEDCANISRKLERQLNEEFDFSHQYTLEVSSPGMDRPLKVMQQFRKNIGRSVEVLLNDGVKKNGVMLYADDAKIILEERNKEIKKAELTQTEISFHQIKSTVVVFNF